MSGYSVQPGKVQPPPLREETLARHRLLDWLDVKVHNRVVFVIAEAGYGKTTLLADFTRRTRLRVLWYRMDNDDRNWVAFLSHLVAAGRVHDQEFAPRTNALLQDTGPGGATRDDALEAFMRELPAIATDGAVLILDDFHVSDDVADIGHIAREIVSRAPERLTIVISSRRMPTLPVARLRALGEVAELRTEDLRFSADETETLFTQTYGRELEPDVLADLSRRTDGWAASLALVKTALRDRSAAETRAFIRGLSGAQSELYDYLAEEVVGDLPADHQTFLMRTSILQTVDPDAAEVASGFDAAKVAALIAASERLGLLSRRQGNVRPGHTYHPLVREFLEARLVREIGSGGVVRGHETVGAWAESVDWQVACHHFAAAANNDAVARVIDGAIERIAGGGGFRLAADYVDALPSDSRRASFEIIRSRLDYQDGDLDSAVARADAALALAPDSDAALNNCSAIRWNRGDHEIAWNLSKRLAETASSPMYRAIAAASCAQYEGSLDGSVLEPIRCLDELVKLAAADGHIHFVGISQLNAANTLRAIGDVAATRATATLAIESLQQSYAAAELSSAFVVRAWAKTHGGDLAGGREDLEAAAQLVPRRHRGEWLVESAEIEATYGSAERARDLVSESERLTLPDSEVQLRRFVQALLSLRSGSLIEARVHAEVPATAKPSDEPARRCRLLAVAAYVAIASGDRDASALLEAARAQAHRQSSGYWIQYCEVLSALLSGGLAFDRLVDNLTELSYVSAVADVAAKALSDLSPSSRSKLERECSRLPERWLPALRREIRDPAGRSRWEAAEIVDLIGTSEDIRLLRGLARGPKSRSRRPSIGRTLARRLAPRVFVDDQGRVDIRVGETTLAGSSLRRKVLALLCFLLTRPKYSATRDEVIDALWPDLDPGVAGNSLNQTVYFLRRVFEPEYKDDLSAGYVHHNSDILWLDRELIAARTGMCRDAIDAARRDPTPTNVERVSDAYVDRFALDFAYEDWAVPFRTTLHTEYLEVVEAAVTADMDSGHHARAIRLARRALEVDPSVDSLELSLLRLYRATGAHAAAAEQYAHYAGVLRDELGIEPPPLASL